MQHDNQYLWIDPAGLSCFVDDLGGGIGVSGTKRCAVGQGHRQGPLGVVLEARDALRSRTAGAAFVIEEALNGGGIHGVGSK